MDLTYEQSLSIKISVQSLVDTIFKLQLLIRVGIIKDLLNKWSFVINQNVFIILLIIQ